MSPHQPKRNLDANIEYTIPDFLALVDDDPQVIELALMRVFSLQEIPLRHLVPHDIKATGAEFQLALEAAARVVNLLRSRPCFVLVEGEEPINVSEPMPTFWQDYFRMTPKP